MFTLLSIICLYLITRIIIQIVSERRCLDEESIRRYMTNKLKEKERHRVIAHLGICETCQQKMHEINFGPDLEDHLVGPFDKD